MFAKANYDENSYCGVVHVPLQEDTMLPKGIALGPNWWVKILYNKSLKSLVKFLLLTCLNKKFFFIILLCLFLDFLFLI